MKAALIAFSIFGGIALLGTLFVEEELSISRIYVTSFIYSVGVYHLMKVSIDVLSKWGK